MQTAGILAGSIGDTISRQANERRTVKQRTVRATSATNFDGGRNVSTRMQKVLKWVNRARWFMSLKPIKRLPKGDKESLYRCPIGRALHEKVAITSESSVNIPCERAPFDEDAEIFDAEIKLKKSSAVVEFIQKFDAGKYPRLVK